MPSKHDAGDGQPRRTDKMGAYAESLQLLRTALPDTNHPNCLKLWMRVPAMVNGREHFQSHPETSVVESRTEEENLRRSLKNA